MAERKAGKAGGTNGVGAARVVEVAVAKDAVADLSYEQARDALAEVVARLEAGNLTLEDSLSLWERGEALAEVAAMRLEGARTRLAAAQEEKE